ncbi:hypothetical protein C8Q79DRAFT_1078761 [Trametes meyenii]|nr:hypothetical protein C8Q79DRAFT_1078761 [Trametes meyenii]
MAGFLSKVFPRKKEKDANKRSSVSSLLEGKFEAVSPTVSPSAAKFEEASQKPSDRGREKEKEKEKEKESSFSLFRPKSRALSPPPDTRKTTLDTPHLTLNLPVPKEERSRALGVVFEADPEDRTTLPDSVIGERRLNPLETLLLVKSTSTAIISNGGLETLGVMHPFWYSASPEVQRKLISLFILSLAPKSPITTLTPSPTSALSTFDTELEYTRSPHDIAAVLRWALRHLRLESESFGRVEEQWKWYQTFAEAERASSYPLNAFSDALVPQLPPSHLQLLIATLDIVSSLAAHSEHNGISGSKLSKFFGLWLLTTKRSEQGDDWNSFYSRWERAGRILEHLFLAHIRDEMARKKMPLRLQELVKGYPYHSRSPSVDTVPSADDDLLPRPRVSTRRYDALYVRVESQIQDVKSIKQKQHPLRLISDALRSELGLTDAQYEPLWATVQKSALANDEPEPILTHVDGYPSVSRIFADETIRLLSLIPAGSSSNATPSVPTIRIPRPPRRRSSSLNSSTKANGNGKASTNGSAANRSAASPTSPTSPKDWMDFSTSGFGDSTLGKDFASTLLDKDVEVTTPRPVVERKTSKKRKASPGRSRRSSVDSPAPESATRVTQLAPSAPPPPKSKSTIVNVIKLDEAFIDFWSDALLDPISADWPNFIVAQLKSIPGLEIDGRPLSWLVLEQRFVVPPPPPTPAEPEANPPPPPRRASSPRPSMRSELSARKSSTLAAAKKRLTFFSSSQTLGGLSSKTESKATARKKAKPTRIGEMGEILSEDDKAENEAESKQPETKDEPKAVEPAPKDVPVTPATETAATGSKETTTPPPAEVASAPVPPIVPAPTSPATDVVSPLTPTADDFPAVPVVGAIVASAAVAATPVAVELLKTEDGETADKPVLTVSEEPPVPADSTPAPSDAPAAPEEKELPPAPEPVVLTGETPGPQVALETSEPAALAEISTKIDTIVAEASSSPEVNELPAEVSPDTGATHEIFSEVVSEVRPVEQVSAPVAPIEVAAATAEPEVKEAQDSPAEEVHTAVSGSAVIPATPAAPQPETVAKAPTVESQVISEALVEETPAVEEVAPVAPEPIVESSPAAPEPVVETPQVADQTQEEPASAPEEPASEVIEKSAPAVEAAPEPEVEVPAAESESTPAASEHEAAVAPVEPTSTIAAHVESEVPVPAEPEPVPEVIAPAEPEASGVPQPQPEPEVAAEAPAPPAEPAQEEPAQEEISIPAPAVEVKDAEGAVVEDAAATAAEDVVVEPTAEEPAVTHTAEEPAAPQTIEEAGALETVEEPTAPESSEAPVAAPAPVTEAKEAPAAEAVEEEIPAPEESPAAVDTLAPEEVLATEEVAISEQSPATETEVRPAEESLVKITPEAKSTAEEEVLVADAVPEVPAVEESATAGSTVEPTPAGNVVDPTATEEKHANGTASSKVEKDEGAPSPAAEATGEEKSVEAEELADAEKPATAEASSD